MEKLQSKDRETAWPGLGDQQLTWWRSGSPGKGRQPGQASESRERPGGEAAVQGQGGSLARPRLAATDLVEKLQSRDRRQPGQASASSDRPGWRSCRLEFSLVRYRRCLASSSPSCSSLEKLPAGLAGLSTLASILGALWNNVSSVKVLH